jgi:hypothetical protein
MMNARLHVLLAKHSPMSLIIRWGPSKRTAIIGWNRKTDIFEVGQWLKGKIYHYGCDVSPNGERWIYFAMVKGQAYTAVARTPYLKAEDFYAKYDAWNGGGLFLSNNVYWLNDTPGYEYKEYRKSTDMIVVSEYPGNGTAKMSESPAVYFLRLSRDGWTMKQEERNRYYGRYVFSKPLNEHFELCKTFHGTIDPPKGKSPYYEEPALQNKANGSIIEKPDWEWADIDCNRLLWAEHGKIMAGVITEHGLPDERELFDTNPLIFTALAAPY